MAGKCCDEPTCRRTVPLRLYRGDLSGRWYLATRVREVGEGFEALERHDVTEQVQNGPLAMLLTDLQGAGVDRAVLDKVAASYGLIPNQGEA